MGLAGQGNDTRRQEKPVTPRARVRRRWRGLGLRPRLLMAFLLVALVPQGLLFLAQYHHTRALTLSLAKAGVERVAQVQQRRLNLEFERMTDHLELVASRTQMRLSLQAYLQTGEPVHRGLIERILRDALAPVDKLGGIWIRDAQGDPVTGVRHAGRLDEVDIQPPYLQGSAISIEVFRSDKGGPPRLWVNGPLVLNDNEIGSLHLLVLADDLLTLLEDFPYEDLGGKTLLLLRSGVEGTRIFGIDSDQDLDICGALGEIPSVTGAGPLRVCDHLLIALPLTHDLGEVVVYVSLQVLKAAFREQMRLLLMMVLFVLPLCLLMALAFTRMISRPVSLLTQATQALRKHQGNVFVKEPLWGEFTDLARSFNLAAGIIIRRTQDLSREVADRRRTQQKLADLANNDALTGLINRRRFMEVLERHMERSREKDGNLTLLYLDLDGFKPVNDRLGHEAGDIVLQVVAERLRNLVRGEDIAARLGGDEFALLLSESDGRRPDSRKLALRAEEQISLPIEAKGHMVNVGCSVGVARARPGDKPQDLLNRADEAMYRIKVTRRERPRDQR
ncbi:GGDEF domain-containing protein [Ectothiorhodospira lacustris]|uniref:GGDEF domain-containing protein n=1 Tax=Ectothiorhodospira lacustris TaxID=2899127 RepID=UPI001EE91625|nr:GGDEF domain-containing protein [Ectothiorhodospira lacustris]MCG5499308.1 GGDEF domain-containing protein [Ectothiorhodospira lacustris]